MAETQEPQVERTDTNPKDTSTFWQVQLELADRDQRDWEKDGKSVVDRYRAESKRAKKGDAKWFNILFSNTETLKSTLYGRTAKPDVRRRFADKDPAAREAAEVIERSLIYCAEAYDVDKCIEPALHDYLLPGRGVVRVVYEPVIKDVEGKEQIVDQVCREEYVYWADYRQNPSRKADDVWWRAFRHIMSRQDLKDNKFEAPEKVPLNWSPDTDDKRPVPDDLKKAEVWEIWDKSRRKRIWIVKGFESPLRIDDDPYGLEGFFPLPEPIRSVEDTETLVPRPEYFEYRDQAEDLDEIVGRISKLTRALKRRGVYDQACKELKRLATANDNQFIPVENYQSLATKGGLAAAFQTEDISMIAVVLKELYVQRDMLVQAIYELTGIADIMRGASDPQETLGAQELKAQFGSTRIKRRQRAVQKWIRDLYKIKAEIIAEHFEPAVLQEMTGIQISPEIVQILRSDKLRAYRIDIETDSTVFEDEASVKQQTTEALTAIGGFFREALPAVMQAPELAPLAFEMVGMAARNLKKGRELEDMIEQTKQAIMQKVAQAQQNPPPNPEQQKLEMQAQLEQQKMAAEQQKAQTEIAFKEKELEIKRQELEIKVQEMQAKLEMERQKAEQEMMLDTQRAQLDAELAQREAAQKAQLAEQEGSIKLEQMEQQGVLDLDMKRQEFGAKQAMAAEAHGEKLKQNSESHKAEMEHKKMLAEIESRNRSEVEAGLMKERSKRESEEPKKGAKGYRVKGRDKDGRATEYELIN